MVLRLESGAVVELGVVLARAGEGTIYEVVGHGDWVVKIFHPGLKDLGAKRAKVAAMIACPPEGVRQADGFVVLTWPLHTVTGDDGAFGYVMPRVDTSNAVEIHTVSNPSNRANPLPSAPQWTPHVTWHHLVNIAANLCLAVETVHRVDAVIGDFQERNILVNDTTRVSLVDCDSMQFTDEFGHQFLCGVGRAEFTAPELAGLDLSTTARQKPSDLFALAVHVHLLLMAGNHPFLRGRWTGGGEQPDALTLARSGQWAGGPGSALHTHALAPSVDFLPDDIQRLFVRAFTDGARDPSRRPSAAEWREHLQRVRVGSCARGHQIPVGAKRCPWCGIEDIRAVRRGARTTTTMAPQTPMPVTAPPAPANTPAGTVGNRKWLAVAGAAAAVIAVLLVLIVTLGQSDTDRSSSTAGSGSGSAATAGDCVPSFGGASLRLTAAGLEASVPISANCDSALELSGPNVVVTVSDGTKDVAAGRFDLAAAPIIVDGVDGADQRLIFPPGMYWRTPELVPSGVTVDMTGFSSEVTSRASGSGAVTAAQPMPPMHGDVQSVAGAALTELSDSDYPAVKASMANHWVPQISSKQVGLFTDGITYQNADILRNHLSLRQQYDSVRLVSSNHWTVFKGPNWWVTMVDAPSSDAAMANGWCDAKGIDSWNCLAKFLSDTVGPEGTTAIR
ncbi:hypothetical protein A5759_03940 [Mycobacterium sp. 852014-52144_SCH5372336]|nr:hypothetical protein A5759_03940 [Mycobacterium sp. 852014-52144_SCH5372336]